MYYQRDFDSWFGYVVCSLVECNQNMGSGKQEQHLLAFSKFSLWGKPEKLKNLPRDPIPPTKFLLYNYILTYMHNASKPGNKKEVVCEKLKNSKKSRV